MLDIIAAPQRAIEYASDTPATIAQLPGGSGANQAAWLGHFGNTTYFAARVGHDGGAEHAAALRVHGVEPLFAIDERARTGVLVTLVGPDGERSFLTDRGANVHLERADLPDRLLDIVTLVHVSGYALFAPGPRAAVCDYLAAAHARGVRVSVDSGSTAFLREIGPTAFVEATKRATLLFAKRRRSIAFGGHGGPKRTTHAAGRALCDDRDHAGRFRRPCGDGRRRTHQRRRATARRPRYDGRGRCVPRRVLDRTALRRWHGALSATGRRGGVVRDTSLWRTARRVTAA